MIPCNDVAESTREMLGLPKEVGRPSEYANLERSLMSGLPNEIDFAVNVCLLLSTEGKHTLKGSKGLRIVELLLSHVGICKECKLTVHGNLMKMHVTIGTCYCAVIMSHLL